MIKMAKSEFEKQFSCYGANHRNPVNLFFHMSFIWPFLFSSLLLLSLPHLGAFNLGVFPTFVYALYYISIDKKAGSLAALLCVLNWVAGSFVAARLGYSLAWKMALATQLFSATALTIGHQVFEKRTPKVKNNLTNLFVVEPFFVFVQALQMFFDYEPYAGFNSSVQVKRDAELKQLHHSEQKKNF